MCGSGVFHVRMGDCVVYQGASARTRARVCVFTFCASLTVRYAPAQASSPSELADALVAAAQAAGSTDDITVVCAKLK